MRNNSTKKSEKPVEEYSLPELVELKRQVESKDPWEALAAIEIALAPLFKKAAKSSYATQTKRPSKQPNK